jgi:uncharacterized protein YndB with AHSA1/START domain
MPSPLQSIHALDVHADPATLFHALTTSAGLDGFWTVDSTAEPRAGSVAEFGFAGAPYRLKMRVERLEPDAQVVWRCLGDFPFWPDSTVTWSLSPANNGTTSVLFRHAGFNDGYPEPAFGSVNFTWGQIMARLKAFVESGTPQPYFPAA